MNVDWIVGLATAGQLALLGGLFWFLPRWSRPELCFAVTVPRELREGAVGQRALRVYRIGLSISLAVAALLGPAVARMGVAWLLLATSTVLLVGVTGAYLAARAVVRPHSVAPTSIREASLSTEREPFALTAFVFPLGLLLLAVVVVALRWPELPDPMPMRFDGSGNVIAWAPKSVGPIAAPLAMGLLLCLSMPLIGRLIARGVRRPDASRPAAVALQARRLGAVRETLLGASWLVALLFAAIPLLQLATEPRQVQLAVVALVALGPLGGLVLIIVLLVRHGSAFTAENRSAEAAIDGAPIGDRSEDRYWKWGAIYYNPDDPAVWVEKRIGIGYTCNFARPAAWWTLGGIVLVPLLVLVAILVLF